MYIFGDMVFMTFGAITKNLQNRTIFSNFAAKKEKKNAITPQLFENIPKKLLSIVCLVGYLVHILANLNKNFDPYYVSHK